MTEQEFEEWMEKLDAKLKGHKPLPEIVRIICRQILESTLGPFK